MSTATDIRAALVRHGPLSCRELATHCPACEHDRQIVASTIATLRAEGKVRGAGIEDGEPIYALHHWPEDAEPGREPRTSADQVAPVADAIAIPTFTAPPAPTGPEEDDPMKTAEHILMLLAEHGPLGVRRLEAHGVKNPAKHLDALIEAGRIQKHQGRGPGRYEIAHRRAAPPAPAKPATARAPVPAPRDASPAATAARTDARFAIDADGVLGIARGDTRLDLDPAEFAKLRDFIARTEPVWQPA